MSDERAVTPGDDPLTRTAETVGGALGSAVKSVSETAQEAASTAASVASSAVSTAKSAGTATTAADAWTALKRERGIELWLESRRLGDFKRWAALSRPGTSDDMTGRNLCFATPLSEKQTNPNF